MSELKDDTYQEIHKQYRHKQNEDDEKNEGEAGKIERLAIVLGVGLDEGRYVVNLT